MGIILPFVREPCEVFPARRWNGAPPKPQMKSAGTKGPAAAALLERKGGGESRFHPTRLVVGRRQRRRGGPSSAASSVGAVVQPNAGMETERRPERSVRETRTSCASIAATTRRRRPKEAVP